MSYLIEETEPVVGQLYEHFRASFHAELDSGEVPDADTISRLKAWDEFDPARRRWLTEQLVQDFAGAISYCGGYEVGDDSTFEPPNPLAALLEALGSEDFLIGDEQDDTDLGEELSL